MNSPRSILSALFFYSPSSMIYACFFCFGSIRIISFVFMCVLTNIKQSWATCLRSLQAMANDELHTIVPYVWFCINLLSIDSTFGAVRRIRSPTLLTFSRIDFLVLGNVSRRNWIKNWIGLEPILAICFPFSAESHVASISNWYHPKLLRIKGSWGVRNDCSNKIQKNY